jgi:hypothetical protein
MVTRTGNQFYQLTPMDGVGIRLTAAGTPFYVPASLDATAIALQDGVTFSITPEMMSGAGSHHQLNIHCFYNTGASALAGYTIEVSDLKSRRLIDTLSSTLPAGTPPIQDYFQLTLWI